MNIEKVITKTIIDFINRINCPECLNMPQIKELNDRKFLIKYIKNY